MVEIHSVSELLKEIDFFREFDAATIELLAGCASNVVFKAGDAIIRENEPADAFFIIRHGDVALEMHVPGREPLVFETLHPGDALGWSWIVPPYKWNYDARAITIVRGLSFDATCLRGKMETDHEIGYQLMRRFIPVMSRRLLGARLQLVDMYGAEAGR
ncbi:MAG: cyclic nucleotide-binding domain-containing protein [Hyphomicrobiales bacterium]|nr:cyclic nucleotide-binding domain-containing protein [Hyphomicrobiales bacterium]